MATDRTEEAPLDTDAAGDQRLIGAIGPLRLEPGRPSATGPATTSRAFSLPAPRLPGFLRDLIATRDSSEWPSSRTGEGIADGPIVPPPAPAPTGRMTGPAADATGPISPAPVRRSVGVDARTRRNHQPPEQRSLFGEILDFMLAPLLLLWPLSVAITFLVARSLADAPFDRALDERVRMLAQYVHVVDGEPRASVPRALQELVRADEEDRVWLQLVSGAGTAAQRLLAGERDLPAPALYDFAQPGVVKMRTTTWRGTEVRLGFMHVALPPDTPGQPVLVQVAETLDKRNRLANEIIKGVIFPQFVILPIAVTLVWFGLSRGLSPLSELQRRIRERRNDDLSPIDARGAPEEIAPLVDAFNDLLDRLGANLRAQKRFIADAAHQMKTPLAGLRMQAELAMRERDPLQLKRSLEQLARSSERTAHLVDQLLALARTENPVDATAIRLLDLTALVHDSVAERVPQALARGIDFGFEPDAAVAHARGHPLLLRELLENLVDNALRYTPDGGAVTVRVRREGDRAVLDVEDTGPGIAPEERELVFGRFYRVLGNAQDGSGLGLAIVREIALQHGATILLDFNSRARDPQFPGTLISVIFPPTDARG